MVKNYDTTLSHFRTIPERNGRTDRQICYINIARLSHTATSSYAWNLLLLIASVLVRVCPRWVDKSECKHFIIYCEL